jgi:lysophospholipase L1-like esterase
MVNFSDCPAGNAGTKTNGQYRLILLLLFIGFLLNQGCKLDPPIIPDSLTHPTPADTTTHGDTTHIDTTIASTGAPATANFDKLTAWAAYKANPASRYDLLLIGDSYTQGNFYSWRLRGKLITDGFEDGGPGYDSFGRWDPVGMYSIDASMDPAELGFTYDPLIWETSSENYFGTCGNVRNISANSVITVTSKVSLDSMTIIFERHASAGNFRYRLNNRSWTTVSAAHAVEDIGNVVVDVSEEGGNIKLDIEPLDAELVFCGAVGKRNGTALRMHKAGSSGMTAKVFAQNDLWSESTQLLTPKGAIIMFGTNEMDANVTPNEMKVNVQNIINKLRRIQPNCDIMIMCPPETLFENEEPRAYKIADYGNMLYKLAIVNHAAFINFPKIFGHFSQDLIDSDLMSSDRKHPGDAGSELMAETIFNAFKK